MNRFSDWLDKELDGAGPKAPSRLARHVGIPLAYVSKMRAGTRQPQAAELPKIENFFGKRSPLTDQFAPEPPDEPAPEPVQGVRVGRIVGYAAGGSQVYDYHIPEQDQERVPLPDSVGDRGVAIEIRGTSLGMNFNKGLVFYDTRLEHMTSRLLGHLCVVGTPEGVYVKVVQRGTRPDRFTLIPFSEGREDPTTYLRDVEILWIAEVKAIEKASSGKRLGAE